MTKLDILSQLKEIAHNINMRGFSNELTSNQQEFLHNLSMEIYGIHDKLDTYSNNPDTYQTDYLA